MASYNVEVKIFALEQRKKRKRWKSIQDSIKKRFGIEPPTIRVMQKWEKTLDLKDLSAEIAKGVKKRMPAIQTSAELSFAQSLLPAIMHAKEVGEDMEITAWKWFLQFMKSQIGEEKLKRVIDEYMRDS
ncbi:MAG: hypothetical protein R6U37_07885 [Dehalococcoidia bacterium]